MNRQKYFWTVENISRKTKLFLGQQNYSRPLFLVWLSILFLSLAELSFCPVPTSSNIPLSNYRHQTPKVCSLLSIKDCKTNHSIAYVILPRPVHCSVPRHNSTAKKWGKPRFSNRFDEVLLRSNRGTEPRMRRGKVAVTGAIVTSGIVQSVVAW